KQNWERGHDNGEAEVAGGGLALPGLLNNVPEHVGPVTAAPPGVKAGSVVGSGGRNPAPNQNDMGETKKKIKYKKKKTHQKKNKKN
ncbi:hypothetical protein ACVGXT_00180, partial [Enterobacter intestinihominis]